MRLTPLGIMQRGLRASLRKRYAYAGLRRWRVTVRSALREHYARMTDPSRPYSIETPEVTAAWTAGARRLKAKFPHLNYLDPRAGIDIH